MWLERKGWRVFAPILDPIQYTSDVKTWTAIVQVNCPRLLVPYRYSYEVTIGCGLYWFAVHVPYCMHWGKEGSMTCVLRLSPFWHRKCKSTVTDATSGAGREAKGAGECATLPAAPVTVETVRSPSTPRLRLPGRTRRCTVLRPHYS